MTPNNGLLKIPDFSGMGRAAASCARELRDMTDRAFSPEPEATDDDD